MEMREASGASGVAESAEGERMSAARKCGLRGRVASSRKRVWPVRRACQLGLEGVSGEDDGPRERNSGRMSLP